MCVYMGAGCGCVKFVGGVWEPSTHFPTWRAAPAAGSRQWGIQELMPSADAGAWQGTAPASASCGGEGHILPHQLCHRGSASTAPALSPGEALYWTLQESRGQGSLRSWQSPWTCIAWGGKDSQLQHRSCRRMVPVIAGSCCYL